MRALVTGAAGELGSAVTEILASEGNEITAVDTVRRDEAWRLPEMEQVEYVWKDSIDLEEEDVENVEELGLVVDCAAVSDRPFGTGSPRATTRNNLESPLNLIERFMEHDPVFIYPATGVSMLGIPSGEQPITETSRPRPVNLYGWTKYAAEELYRTYSRSHDLKVVVTRSGSVYGEGMRSNQAIAQFIMKALQGEDIEVRSPEATRTPQYVEDVKNFYSELFRVIDSDPEKVTGETLISGGNAEDRDYTVLEMAEKVVEVVGGKTEVYPSDNYEKGERVEGDHVRQYISPSQTREILDWEPEYSFREGLERTVEWFRETDRYSL